MHTSVAVTLTLVYIEYRGSMARIVHQLSLMMPRTAAEEAHITTQDLIARTSGSTESVYRYELSIVIHTMTFRCHKNLTGIY